MNKGIRHYKLPLPSEIKKNIRRMRHESTDAEAKIWYFLRNRRFGGAKFRRQHPIGQYILDFYCYEAKLAIELDGGGHGEQAQSNYDIKRARELEYLGIRVLRFWNHEVFQNTEEVLRKIWEALYFPHPNPLPEGEGKGREFVPEGEGEGGKSA